MAKETTPTGDVEEFSSGYSSNDFEWENVHEEAPDQLVFDTVGDEYIGVYAGHEIIDPQNDKDPKERFIQLRFRNRDGSIIVTNAGYELRTAFVDVDYEDDNPRHITEARNKINGGTLTRIKLIKEVPIQGQNSPMKSFRVDVGKAKPQSANSKA